MERPCKQKKSHYHCGHCMEAILKLAGKGLRWIFQQISKTNRNFTMHKINEIKEHLKTALRKLRQIHGENTEVLPFQFDIEKNVYQSKTWPN